MDEDVQIQSHWTVDETLKHKPQTSRVFIRFKTQCVGCFLQKFCKINDVAEVYEVNLDAFLKNLNDYKKQK